MKFDPPLIPARLSRRYQRFLADVVLDDGQQLTVHCPNTGAMTGCAEPGSRVWLSRSQRPGRKYAHTWELAEAQGTLVGINTSLPNRLVCEAIAAGIVGELSGYGQSRSEVRFGVENSRVDLLLSGPGRPDCYVEVKNVTAAVSAGVAFFPDAVTLRGTRHLRELMAVASAGARAVLVFCVQRADVAVVSPADHIDADYGRALRTALQAGVEVLAYGADVSPQQVWLKRPLRVHCPPLE